MPARTPFSSAAAAALYALASACVTDAPPEVTAGTTEHGRWEVVAATRGGQPTGTLDAAYFDFDTAAHMLTTNLTGEELRLRYAHDVDDAMRLRLEGSELLGYVRVGALTDSTLALATTIAGTAFGFELERAEAGGPEARSVGRPAGSEADGG